MPCQPSGLAPFRGHDKHIHIPVVLARKSNPFSIRRKHRQPLVSARCQLPGIAAVARDAPKVAAVSKNDLGLAYRRRTRKQRRFLRRLRQTCNRQEDANQNCRSKTHVPSLELSLEQKFLRWGKFALFPLGRRWPKARLADEPCVLRLSV